MDLDPHFKDRKIPPESECYCGARVSLCSETSGSYLQKVVFSAALTNDH